MRVCESMNLCKKEAFSLNNRHVNHLLCMLLAAINYRWCVFRIPAVRLQQILVLHRAVLLDVDDPRTAWYVHIWSNSALPWNAFNRCLEKASQCLDTSMRWTSLCSLIWNNKCQGSIQYKFIHKCNFFKDLGWFQMLQWTDITQQQLLITKPKILL